MQLTPTIENGVKLFVQLITLRENEAELRWVKDEEDLRIELSRVADCIEDTASMLDRTMYRKTPYRFSDDAKLTVEEVLLRGEDERATALLRKHHGPMFHTVLDPVLDHMGTLPHAEALTIARPFTEAVHRYALTVDVNTHLDDAIVAKAVVKNLIKTREAERKAVKEALAKERRKRKKKDPDLEIPKESDVDPDDIHALQVAE